jgi:hypothetical protein
MLRPLVSATEGRRTVSSLHAASTLQWMLGFAQQRQAALALLGYAK